MARISVLAGLVCLLMLLASLTVAGPGCMGEEQEEERGEEGPDGNRIAVLETDHGIIKFELYENWTPITANNFISLASSGHYDGVLFHRIVDDFVIQTGDGGGSGTIPLETHPNATHIDGAVGMTRSSDPDSASDQFYICDGAQHGLDDASVNPDGSDPGYAVFGVVVEGMDVVHAIAETPVVGENNPRPGAAIPLIWQNSGTPKEDVLLQKVTIEVMEVNETVLASDLKAAPSESSSFWILGVVAVPVVAILLVFRGKKMKGKVDAKGSVLEVGGEDSIGDELEVAVEASRGDELEVGVSGEDKT
ncbi:MAG: peptidylprolyl isomerase [Thermoplasmata archaeon]|nr:peptidylprolyl isomerase [Thermoplasmata archaeon]